MKDYLTELGLEREELLIGSSIFGFGCLLIALFFPVETIGIIIFISLITLGVITMRNFMNKSNKNLTLQAQEVVKVPDNKLKFVELMKRKINKLALSASDKSKLFLFTMTSEKTLKEVLASEKIPCSLVGVNFGALTVTYSLKLKQFSRSNLDKLMKLDDLLCQALSVESVRLLQRAGFIDLEVSSPVRVNIDLKALQADTNGSVVVLGMDSILKPVSIDISQHGLIAAIAPSRRGKTQSIRTMLYLLKKANPTLNIVVCAFKVKDWAIFNGSANIILDSEELSQFQTWLVSKLYERAKNPQSDKWVVVFDDLVNLLSTNPELVETIKQCASLGAGVGITTIASTQFTGKASGGTDIFANASCRLLFKPSSNLQGSRDGGQAGLGLDQLSSQKGDSLLVCDGEVTRLSTAMVADNLIESLPKHKPERDWMIPLLEDKELSQENNVTSLALHPMEVLIEKLNGWLLENDVFNFETGKFNNRSEAIRKLGWNQNGRDKARLAELEEYISANHVM